ncbi:arrestin domain protein [Necator americanus]|uniref:Arrestin domain protein n=1 Tax=Necator americanus TaxID=51031 RepID=W2SI82_NECAM|nr:arrestin domain protein [Necator americanus]ETN69258.1 arrestin domain protein [Necator americanus]
MPENCLYITYSNPQAVYQPGTNVTGVANLDLKEPIKARSLKIIVDGRAYTHWRVTRSRSVRTTRTENYTVPYSATVIYATGETIAWEAARGSKEVLQPGFYQFPFTFLLPSNCAPSFEGAYGYIRYMVKIELDRPWRFNKTDKKPFTVIPVFDLNTVPQAAIPLKDVKVKNLGVVLFRHGKVTVECELPKTGFVPGEMVVINARIINDSSKSIVKKFYARRTS